MGNYVSATTLLFELVQDVDNVVADDEKRCDSGHNLRNFDQGLNLGDLGDDGLLRVRSLLKESSRKS